jgi:hypothetical protein
MHTDCASQPTEQGPILLSLDYLCLPINNQMHTDCACSEKLPRARKLIILNIDDTCYHYVHPSFEPLERIPKDYLF